MHSRRHHGGSAAAVAHRPGDSRALGANGCATFEIRRSAAQPGVYQRSRPTRRPASVPGGSLRPANRRYRRLPNCTHCGPRFTIIRDIRMTARRRRWPLRDVPDCRAEYENPLDRRFHAQPNACPVGGPKLEIAPAPPIARSVGRAARRPDRGGAQPAAPGPDRRDQGVGGYHWPATRPRGGRADAARAQGPRRQAVRGNGRRSRAARRLCDLDAASEQALTVRERPIVLLPWRAGSPIAPEVAPGLR